MTRILQKIHIGLLIGLVLIEGAPAFVAPKTARAFVTLSFETNPVMTANAVKTSTESTITATAASASLSQQLLEWAQSFVLATLKRRILDVMVDQVVTWIQGGGEPRFITDWESFLGDIGQGAVGEFVEQIGAGFLCEPFSLQVRIGLLPVKRFADNAPFRCTLDKIVQNVENFYEDFRNGGWIAYDAASQLNNNYYGSLLVAWDARNSFVANKIAAAANSALANKGFLGTRRCYDIDTGADVPEGAPFSRCEDTTPGGIVSATLEKAVGTDFDFIINAQQLGDYAAAIVNALVNRIIMEGVNGIRGVHQGSGSSYQPSQRAGTTYGGYSSEGSLPQDTRTAISGYASAAGGGSVLGLTRQELLTRVDDALTRRTALQSQLETPLETADNYNTIVSNTLLCHESVPSLRSGSIHDAVIANQTDARNYLNMIEPIVEDNDAAIVEYEEIITELNTMTDAQFNSRKNDFQTIFISTQPGIIDAELTQGSTAIQQINTFITSAVSAEAERDLNYCFAQGGSLPGVLPTPRNFSARPVGSRQIRLSWTPPTNTSVAGYLIERCRGRSCANFNQVASIGTVSAYSDSGVLPRVIYSYRIRARDAAGATGNYSRTATARTR